MRSALSKTLQALARARRPLAQRGECARGLGEPRPRRHWQQQPLQPLQQGGARGGARSFASKSRKNITDIWDREIREAKARDRSKGRLGKVRRDAQASDRALAGAVQALDPVRRRVIHLVLARKGKSTTHPSPTPRPLATTRHALARLAKRLTAPRTAVSSERAVGVAQTRAADGSRPSRGGRE